MFPNAYREDLGRLRSVIHHIHEVTDKAQLAEIHEATCKKLGELHRAALETGNLALFWSAVHLTTTYAEGCGKDPREIYSDEAKKMRPRRPIAFCTICGREWRAGDPGWMTWQVEGGGWAGEIFATCSDECSGVFTGDSCPGYVSFASQRELDIFLRGAGFMPPPPPRSPPVRKKSKRDRDHAS
jgi:hypothetical protein